MIRKLFTGLQVLPQEEDLRILIVRIEEMYITGMYGTEISHLLNIESLNFVTFRSLDSSHFRVFELLSLLQNRRIGMYSHWLWKNTREMQLQMVR